MKKYVLSAVVTGLLVPAVYGMDDGAAPAVEVEVPVAEVEATVEDAVVTDEVQVEVVEVEATVEGEVTTLEAPIEGEVPKEDATDDLFRRDVIEAEATVLDDTCVDENGVQIEVCYFGGVAPGGEGGEGGDPKLDALDSQGGQWVDVNGEPVIVYVDEVSADGETVDPNLVDLASQSGVANEDGSGPNVFHALNDAGGEVKSDGEAPVDSVQKEGEENPQIRYFSAGEIQPNFRGGSTERTNEVLSAATVTNDAPSPQMLNDEQRGAVRGLRSEEEPAKSRSGLGKLFSKFRKPKAEVTLASATTTDKALAAKLAEVDRMRDTALRTGDQKLLAKADKIEKDLRSKFGKASQIPTRAK